MGARQDCLSSAGVANGLSPTLVGWASLEGLSPSTPPILLAHLDLPGVGLPRMPGILVQVPPALGFLLPLMAAAERPSRNSAPSKSKKGPSPGNGGNWVSGQPASPVPCRPWEGGRGCLHLSDPMAPSAWPSEVRLWAAVIDAIHGQGIPLVASSTEHSGHYVRSGCADGSGWSRGQQLLI